MAKFIQIEKPGYWYDFNNFFAIPLGLSIWILCATGIYSLFFLFSVLQSKQPKLNPPKNATAVEASQTKSKKTAGTVEPKTEQSSELLYQILANVHDLQNLNTCNLFWSPKKAILKLWTRCKEHWK